MDQRNCIKFCVENEIQCARTFEMLTAASGEATMSRTQVQLWYIYREDKNDVKKLSCGILVQSVQRFSKYRALFLV